MKGNNLLYCIICILLGACQHSNKFSPGEIWVDDHDVHINAHGGGILKKDNIYYWFGEHKVEGGSGNLAQVGVHCYSSKNLYDWKDEGIALAVSDDSTSLIHKGCVLERPKVIYNTKNDKYVMWFHLEPNSSYSGAMSGVAISDKPQGPYQFLYAKRQDAGSWPINVQPCHLDSSRAKEIYSGGDLPEHPDSLNILGRDFKGGQMARDMNLFVDDDGTAYHIYSSEDNSTLHIARLSDDYTYTTGEFGRFFVNRFMEAPAMFKHNGNYYLIMSGCTGWAPNAGRSAVASSIMGPWEELENPFRGENAETSFFSQSTYVLPTPNSPGTFIYMGDRWTPENAIDGRYIWLPIRFEGRQPIIEWHDNWSLSEL